MVCRQESRTYEEKHGDKVISEILVENPNKFEIDEEEENEDLKQFDETYTLGFAQTSAEDDNKHLVNVHDDKVVQRLNGYVGAINDREYLQPDPAIKQLQQQIRDSGITFFANPKVDSDKGNATVELTQFGGRYGKTPTIQMVHTMSLNDEIENGEYIS